MSTRAQVRFATREEGVSFSEHPEQFHAQFYKHHDGYPEGLGIDLATTLLDSGSWNGVKSLTATPITPTIKINNEFLLPGRDFINPQNLIEIISNFKESQYSENRRILELTKTLNFNIFTAFNRLNAVLQQIENKLNTKENEHKSTS